MKKGYCQICQKYGELTYEHIPPEKAFNFTRAKSIEGESALELIVGKNRMPWDSNGLKYVNKQRGMGDYILCKSCNNLTGTYYGNEYVKFAHTIYKILMENKCENNILGIHIEKINPLLIAKQILSMFCSTCPYLTKKDSHLIKLLLNKDSKGIDITKYRLSMFILKNYRIAYTGLMSMLLTGNTIKLVATIDAFPFGFVLELDPKGKCKELDITSFFNDYDNKEYNVDFGIPIYEHNTQFPIDYRTKQEIEECVKENEKIYHI